MSNLQDLLERVTAATGPDRELDAEVMFDLFAKPVGQREDGGPTGYLWPEDNPSWSFFIRFPGKEREWFTAARQKVDGETLVIWRDGAWVLANSLRIPPLTTSIDAALALCERVLGDDWYALIDTRGVHVRLYHRSGAADDACGLAPTPALALIAAALTALIAQQSDLVPTGGERGNSPSISQSGCTTFGRNETTEPSARGEP
jgi:hypothetical protein